MSFFRYTGPATALNQALPDVPNVTAGPFLAPGQVLELPEGHDRVKRLVDMGLLKEEPAAAKSKTTPKRGDE